ncbi:retrovirus-related pol polyprotein from transposon TNT 1-94 [Tanacetum coccineum]|uniref:Retrovirus-related pol polyprotein from transposon TNT 1-94 n=1 Tax=Tanacetum coccineum TaxID=301880 RepID=A0ABQ4ZCD3_9ASTR
MSNSNTNLQTQSSNALHNAIMEAGSKDRPPMLAPGNYVQWKSRIKRYIDTKPNSELIHHCLQNPPYTYQWAEKTVPVAEGSSETTTERYMENYKNVSQDIRDQLNAEAEAVQIILTGIDNDIYSTVDACPNACEIWKAIEKLKQGESINVQDLETNLFGSLENSHHGMFLLQLQPEWQRSQQSTRNKGKAIVTSSASTYDLEPATVTDDEEMSKETEIDKLMALISLSFKKIYKPTNNNLRTSSNTSRANQDNSPRINRGTGYDNQRAVNVAGARENVGTPVVQKSGIQCYNCKEYGHVSRECQKPKRVKDAAYHKEKMLLCKQEEAGVQLNAEQADWKDDTDDESEEQELEAHYMYMAQCNSEAIEKERKAKNILLKAHVPNKEQMKEDYLWNGLCKRNLKAIRHEKGLERDMTIQQLLSHYWKLMELKRVRVDGKAPVGFDKKKLECFNCHNTSHFARECTAKGTHDGKKKRDSFYQPQELGNQEKESMEPIAEPSSSQPVPTRNIKTVLVQKDQREIGDLLLRPQQVIIGEPLDQTPIVMDHPLNNLVDRDLVRSDNGTEFEELEICLNAVDTRKYKQDYSNARTPQKQNELLK